MYERQFGLRENPFAAGHQSKYVYPSREHQEALAHLRFGIENREAFVLITGEVGTGKTTALYDALTEWKSRAVVALITNSALTRSELYEEICMRFGVPISGPTSKPQMIGQLERHLMVVRARGDFAILIIDEAQNLDEGLLEETRLLSNLESQGQKLLQIFLVGQPELEDKLAQPALRQLRQRIAVHYRLRPLSVDDTERYIHHRITVAGGHALTAFPADSCVEVHNATHGIPREINTVAAQALLNAFVEDSQTVRPEHVRAIVRDTGFHSVLDPASAPPASAGSAPTVATPATLPVATSAPPHPTRTPAADSPVPVSPPHDAPAHTREVRQVPEPAPDFARGPGQAPPHSIEPEGQTMAGVRPAGSAESWQSWMDSLAKIPPDKSGETKDATDHHAGGDATPKQPEAAQVHAPGATAALHEMSAEEFYAVEEAAMRAEIADHDSDLADGSENGDYDEQDGHEADAAPGLTRGVNEAPATKWSEAATARPQEPQADAILPIAFPKVAPEAATIVGAAAPIAPVVPVARLQAPVPLDHEDPPVPAVRHEAPLPRVSAAPAQPMQPAAALPIRLRERLEAAERAEEASGSRATGWLIGAAALAAVAIGIVLFMRSQKPEQAGHGAPTRVSVSAPAQPVKEVSNTTSSTSAATAEKPAATAATSPAPSTTVTPPATSTAPAPHATSPAPATTIEARTPSNPSAATTRAAATTTAGSFTAPAAAVKPAAPHVAPKVAAVAKPAAPKALFGISVASFLAEDRATSELTRLKAATGLTGRVMPTKDGDYRVVLGSFPDRGAAEDAAGNLIGSSKVDEARVVSLGSAPVKH